MEAVEKTKTNELFHNLQKKISWQHRSFVKKAFLIAQEAHRYQQRRSGEPYITHPLSVAIILTDYSSDPEVIAAALLHDVLEDTDVSNETIIHTFGEKVYHLVEGVTKINKLKNQSKVESQASNLVKLVMASSKDQRIILIKIADRLHNMRTLGSMPEEKRLRIANETIKIFAPIAGRVGIYKIKSELEDLCLRYLEKEEYTRIREWVDQKKEDRQSYIEKIKSEIESHLKSYRIRAKIEGRSKHFYSIYRKLNEKGRSFNEIYDLYGIRIITRDVSECFTALGVIHSVYNHIPGRFKDYINHRKKNGYQSIHTTVNGPDNINIEVQIRTNDMHLVAEYGIAAHWKYKEKIRAQKNKDPEIEMPGKAILSDSDIAKPDSTRHIYEEIVEDLQEKEDIYVFTPNGDLHVFPQNSSVLDFAFRIHTDLGIHCAGAKINERLVSIRTNLRNGDKIQIITNPVTKPNNDWLRYVVTSHAKNRIRNWMRKNTQDYSFPVLKEAAGRPKPKVPVQDEQKKDKLQPGQKSKSKSKKKGEENKKPDILDLIEWDGIREVKKKIPKCCHPEYGKPIIGYITRGDGITIHDEQCRIVQRLKEDPEKESLLIDLSWVGIFGYITEIIITGKDRFHIYYDIIRAFDFFGVDIKHAEAETIDNKISDKFKLEVDSREQLDAIVQRLEAIDGIKKVEIQCFRKKRYSE